MKKVLYLLILAVCFVGPRGYAQTRYAATQKKYTVTIQPLQLLKNSLRFDLEKRIKNGPGWLQFGPAFYYIPPPDRAPHYAYIQGNYYYNDFIPYRPLGMFEPCSGLLGGGLDLNYKCFIDPKRTIYFLGGLSFTHFNIRYWGWEWNDFTADGLQYHEYLADYYHQRINRTGINGLFGFQIPSRHAFLVDMFGGFSYRHSFSDKNKPSFDTDMFSHGFTGLVFVTGLRFGIGIKD